MGVDYANDTDILKIDRLQANSEPVSYTHLDVYKRQIIFSLSIP